MTRVLRGDPPVTEPVDVFARYGLFAGWLLGIVAMATQRIFLIAPAGLVFASIGVMVFTNFRSLRDRMRVREERTLAFRLTEARSGTKFGGAILTIIGLGWFSLGLSSLFD